MTPPSASLHDPSRLQAMAWPKSRMGEHSTPSYSGNLSEVSVVFRSFHVLFSFGAVQKSHAEFRAKRKPSGC